MHAGLFCSRYKIFAPCNATSQDAASVFLLLSTWQFQCGLFAIARRICLQNAVSKPSKSATGATAHGDLVQFGAMGPASLGKFFPVDMLSSANSFGSSAANAAGQPYGACGISIVMVQFRTHKHQTATAQPLSITARWPVANMFCGLTAAMVRRKGVWKKRLRDARLCILHDLPLCTCDLSPHLFISVPRNARPNPTCNLQCNEARNWLEFSPAGVSP